MFDLTPIFLDSIKIKDSVPIVEFINALEKYSAKENLQLDWDSEDGEEWGGLIGNDKLVLLFRYDLPLVFVESRKRESLLSFLNDMDLYPVIFPVDDWDSIDYEIDLTRVGDYFEWREGVSAEKFSILELMWASI